MQYESPAILEHSKPLQHSESVVSHDCPPALHGSVGEAAEGGAEGEPVGAAVMIVVGAAEGAAVAVMMVAAEGAAVRMGAAEGAAEGAAVGTPVGAAVRMGAAEGATVVVVGA